MAFLLSYPLLYDSLGYRGFLRSLIPSPVCFCGYGILFLALIPAAARLLGVSYWLSCFHTLAGLLLRVSHSFSYSHTRYYMTPWGIMVSFSLPYPLLYDSLGYHGFLRSPIPSPVYLCGYRILFLTPIPAAARLLGVSWFPSLSHTRCCLAPLGMILAFSLSYPPHLTVFILSDIFLK